MPYNYKHIFSGRAPPEVGSGFPLYSSPRQRRGCGVPLQSLTRGWVVQSLLLLIKTKKSQSGSEELLPNKSNQ